jgi:hypothetical protein
MNVTGIVVPLTAEFVELACLPQPVALRVCLGNGKLSALIVVASSLSRARVTGVACFDFKHGQSDVAPNAVELHPILRFHWPQRIRARARKVRRPGRPTSPVSCQGRPERQGIRDTHHRSSLCQDAIVTASWCLRVAHGGSSQVALNRPPRRVGTAPRRAALRRSRQSRPA